jgi:FdhE protein
MAQREWQRRIARAEQLGREYQFAAEVLRFYVIVARFQERFYEEIFAAAAKSGEGSSFEAFGQPPPSTLIKQFSPFLSVIEQDGPGPLQQAARHLLDASAEAHLQLLTAFWNATGDESVPSGPDDFFARAFLQPYAVHIRSRLSAPRNGSTPYVCPFCQRKPGLGVLRPLGDGSQRSLICSFCLGEWEFRRLVCPACGEEDHAKLPVYTAEELKHVRVEACDTCRSYIKTVDLTKSGLGDPVVDEIASIPLDLWAQGQGYTKLQLNLLQL